jgi:hypothetical protein
MSRRAHERGRTSTGESAPVRRWEYLEVDVHVETWSDSAGRSGRLPIAEAGPGQVPSVLPVLNALGQEGWELAGVSNTQSPLIYRLFMKRRATGART